MRVTKRKALVLPLTAVVFGASVAFAAWTSQGSGSGTAQSTTDQTSVIAAGTHAADLFPGATNKTITVTISNPNGYAVKVTSISAGSSTALETPTCAAGTVTSTARSDANGLTQSNGSTVNIAAGGSGTYTLTTAMLSSADDNCKSREFTLPLTANLTSL